MRAALFLVSIWLLSAGTPPLAAAGEAGTPEDACAASETTTLADSSVADSSVADSSVADSSVADSSVADSSRADDAPAELQGGALGGDRAGEREQLEPVELWIEEGPRAIIVRVTPPDFAEREDARLEIRALRAGRPGAILQGRRLPSFLFRDGMPEVEGTWHAVRGSSPVLQIVIDAGEGDIDVRRWESWLLPPGAPGNPDREFRQIWSGRRSGLDHGERITIADPSDSGRDRILVHFSHPFVQWCGRGDVLLSPRAFDARSSSFRPVALPLVPAENAGEMDRSEEFLPDRLSRDTVVEWVSSRGDSAVEPSHGRAPEALLDGDAQTGWAVGGPQGGVGQFLRARVVDGFEVVGLTVRTGIDGVAEAPRRLLISMDDGREFLLEPTPGVRESWLFPEPIGTGCVSVGIVDGAAGGRPVGLAELRLHTQADLVELEEAILELLLPMLETSLGTLHERRLQEILASVGPEGLPVLLEAIEEAEGGLQTALVMPITSIDGGAAALTRWMARGESERATVREYGRRVGTDRERTTTYLVSMLLGAETDEAISDVLRVLSRSVDSDRSLVLAPMLGSSHLGHQAAAREGLFRSPPRRLEPLVEQAWLGNAEAAISTLRALNGIGLSPERERPMPLVEPAIGQLRDLTAHENGSVARLAVAAIGTLRVEDLRAHVVEMAVEDPHPHMRAEALGALARLDERRSWLPPWERPEIALRLATADLLLDALANPSPVVRQRAARLLHGQDLLEARHWDRIVTHAWAEEWPEIRRALHRVAIWACDPGSDAEVVSMLLERERSEVRAALRSFQSRPCRVPGRELRRLDEGFGDDESVLLTLAQLAARSGDADAGAWIVERVQNPETGTYAQRALLEAVGRKRMDDVMPLLEPWLTDPDPVLRRAAVRAWAYQESPEAEARMERALEVEEDPRVRDTIERVIRSIQANRELREQFSGPRTR